MTAKNRAGAITKLHAALKKHYKPAPAAPGRPLLEHILYAALLEDAPAELADEGFAKCEQEFFDWNEVRVTSVTELAEVLTRFPSPPTTAARLKRCLQSVFETFYNFDIDHLKKENLGKAVAKFESMSGMSPFVLAYLVQHGLGGHAIPVNAAAMQIMFHAGIVSEAEARSGKVPGLERAIPKSKAIEFASVLHQAAVALQADPQDKTVWAVILSVNEDAQVSTASKPQKKSSKSAAAGTDTAEAAAKEDKGEPKSSGKSKSAAKATATTKAATGKDAVAAPAKSPAKAAKPAATPEPADAEPVADAAAPSEPAAKEANKSAASAKPASKPAAPAKPRTVKGAGPLAAAKKAADKTPKKPTASKPPTDTKPPTSKGTAKAADDSSLAADQEAAGADEAAPVDGDDNRTLAKQKPR